MSVPRGKGFGVAGRHARRRFRRGWKVSLLVVCLLVATGGGATYAAYRYDQATVNRILPGVSIAGVDVSGMTRAQALAAVSARARADLASSLTVHAGGQRWTLTRAQLGVRTPAAQAVDRALALTHSLDTVSRVWHRLRDVPLGEELSLPSRTSRATVAAFVDRVARAVAVDPVDAELTVRNGRVVPVHAVPGRALDTHAATARVLTALRSGASEVALKTRAVAPKVTDRALGPTIVVRRDVHQLFLYEGFRISKTYPVATAAAGYETPPGSWTVVDKQENPTWTNPAPTTWGADLPASIPPGPGNPLGTRALYLNAPGIRIHGTEDVASVGTNASHGCIRMLMPDIEALYPLVPIGTPVFVI
jgi:lipoprotein-anchoring transpeptidase ErfK/SrfK